MKKAVSYLKNQAQENECNENMETVVISNHLASISQPYPLVYSEPCQTSKIESFARKFMRKNSIPVENL